jgi:hypothetical protein
MSFHTTHLEAGVHFYFTVNVLRCVGAGEGGCLGC